MKLRNIIVPISLLAIVPSVAHAGDANWVEYAQEVSPQNGLPYWNYYSADMVVPPTPPHNGQAIAFWGGILGAKCLLQPALTFDDISNEPKHDWQLRNQYICGNNPQVVGGTISVKPGDIVGFSITLTSVLHNQHYTCANHQKMTGDSWAWTLQAIDKNTDVSSSFAAVFGPCDGNNVGAQILYPAVQEKQNYHECGGTGSDPVGVTFFDIYMGATATSGIPYSNTQPLVPLTTFPVPGPYVTFASAIVEPNPPSCFYYEDVSQSGTPGSIYLF